VVDEAKSLILNIKTNNIRLFAWTYYWKAFLKKLFIKKAS
jgi:hypothetical protein